MKKFLTILVLLPVVLLQNSCVLSYGQSPKISNLSAESVLLYPLQNTELRCVATSSVDDSLTYKWSSTEGTFTGNGPVVKWNAPNDYGKFHIMVIVEDSKGRSSKETITVEVVPHQNDQQGCSTCNRR